MNAVDTSGNARTLSHVWHGLATRALALDDAQHLALLMSAGSVRAQETIDLAALVESLSATRGAAGVVSPLAAKSTIDTDNLVRSCRSAASASLPDRDVTLVELSLLYGAYRCFDMVAADGARIDPMRAESLLVHFMETRAWRQAIACWGSCLFLSKGLDATVARPMVAVHGRGSGAKVRFFDPLPAVQRLARFMSLDESETRRRVIASLRASLTALVDVLPTDGAVDRLFEMIDPETAHQRPVSITAADGIDAIEHASSVHRFGDPDVALCARLAGGC
jgi:hypothetical protein